MDITNPETIIFLLLKKNDEYAFRQNTEFLPKGSSIVAILVKSDEGVTCINQGIRLNERFLSHGPLPKYAPFAVAPYFARLWSLGIDPDVILNVINAGPYNVVALSDDDAPKIRMAFEELKLSTREIPGEFERTMR
jgi:hypothetical protein